MVLAETTCGVNGGRLGGASGRCQLRGCAVAEPDSGEKEFENCTA